MKVNVPIDLKLFQDTLKRLQTRVQEGYQFMKNVGNYHGCPNHSNLEMEAECLTKILSYLNLNISRTKNGRNNL